MIKVCVVTAALLASPAFGQAASVSQVEPQADTPRNYLNLRLGVSTATQNGRPEMCLEVSPLERLSIEGCGTGSGFLHSDPRPELGHFRAKLGLGGWRAGPAHLMAHAGLGFAELQVGEDGPGFQFTGVGPNGVETAGPEATVSLRALLPIKVGVELVGELAVGSAYLPHAPELIRPAAVWLPFAGFSLGVGF
jgi:hypothetical protein